MKKRLFGNLTSLLLIKGVDFFIPIFIFPLLINRLGIDKFGVISFALAFSLYFSGVIQYGNNLTVVRYVSKFKDDISKVNVYISNVLCALCISSLLSIAIVLVIIQLPIFSENGYVLLLAVIYVVFESFIPTWLFQGHEKMLPLGIVGSSIKVGLMCYLVFFLSPTDTPSRVIYAFILSSLLTAVTLLVYARYKNFYTRFIPSGIGIHNFYREGFHAFITQFSPTLYSSSVVVILGITASPIIVGIFVAAQKFVNISVSFLLIVFNVIYPFLVNNRNLENKVCWMFFLTSIVLSCSTALAGQFLLPFIINEKVDDIGFMMMLLSPMILFFGVRVSFGQLHFFLDSTEKTYSKILILASLLGLVLGLVVIPHFSLIGAAFTMVFVNIIIVIAVFYKRTSKPI